jgi:hypothetical protein
LAEAIASYTDSPLMREERFYKALMERIERARPSTDRDPDGRLPETE